jgi:hydantoinase/carbamoylase family amidase
VKVNRSRLAQHFETLAQYGKIGETGVCRPTLSPVEKEAFQIVGEWMREAGMSVKIDHFGNLIGHLEGKVKNAPILMMGSHLDSQPYGGRFDGTAGVLAGIEAVCALTEAELTPEVPIEVVAFCDEESWRFKKGMFGSRGIVGLVRSDELLMTDREGITRREALIAFGCDPDKLQQSVYPSGSIGAYLELHIEQGPILDSLNQPVGLVTSIAGPLWLTVRVKGFAGHAGSVPMNMRKDALLGAANMINTINHIARQEEGKSTVATVGSLSVFPDSPNIIPEEVEFTIDLRDADLNRRNQCEQQIRAEIAEISAQHGLTFEITENFNFLPVECSPWIRSIIREQSEGLLKACPELMSGPFHDAVVLAQVCDMGMIFVRCKDGISHNPAEFASYDDLAEGTELLMRTAWQVSAKFNGMAPTLR